jgi:hypothetical protein
MINDSQTPTQAARFHFHLSVPGSEYNLDDNLEAFYLVESINMIPGIETSSISLLGPSIWIYGHKDYTNSLTILGRIMSRNYGGFQNYNPKWPDEPDTSEWIWNGGWKITLDYTDRAEIILDGLTIFQMSSGLYSGDVARQQMKLIGDNIREHLEHKTFCDGFGITPYLRESKINELIS